MSRASIDWYWLHQFPSTLFADKGSKGRARCTTTGSGTPFALQRGKQTAGVVTNPLSRSSVGMLTSLDGKMGNVLSWNALGKHFDGILFPSSPYRTSQADMHGSMSWTQTLEESSPLNARFATHLEIFHACEFVQLRQIQKLWRISMMF